MDNKSEFFNDLKEEFKEIGSKVNQLFDDFVKGEGEGGFDLKVDAYETNDEFIFQADFPGMSKSDVKVQIKENDLILKGERKRPAMLGEVTYHKKERAFGAFNRSFVIPAGVDSDSIKASFENGILTVKFPKSGSLKKETEIDID